MQLAFLIRPPFDVIGQHLCHMVRHRRIAVAPSGGHSGPVGMVRSAAAWKAMSWSAPQIHFACFSSNLYRGARVLDNLDKNSHNSSPIPEKSIPVKRSVEQELPQWHAPSPWSTTVPQLI